jgi:hypothetical protein
VISAEEPQIEDHVLERQLKQRSFRAIFFFFLDFFFSLSIRLKHMIETVAAFACRGVTACSCKHNFAQDSMSW